MSDKQGKKGMAKSPRQRGPYLSPLKRKNIVARRAAGQTVIDVAAAEQCGKNTVSKVTNSPEGQAELRRLGDDQTTRLREELRGLVPAALRALAEAVREDPNIAYKILRAAGIARYQDESKVQLTAVDPYADWSREDKEHYIHKGHRLSECTCPKPTEGK